MDRWCGAGRCPLDERGSSSSSCPTRIAWRRPSSGGHWLHLLIGLERARIWWVTTDAVEESEDAVLSAFADAVPADERAALPDRAVVLPFANLRTTTGERKATGLANSLLAG